MLALSLVALVQVWPWWWRSGGTTLPSSLLNYSYWEPLMGNGLPRFTASPPPRYDLSRSSHDNLVSSSLWPLSALSSHSDFLLITTSLRPFTTARSQPCTQPSHDSKTSSTLLQLHCGPLWQQDLLLGMAPHDKTSTLLQPHCGPSRLEDLYVTVHPDTSHSLVLA